MSDEEFAKDSEILLDECLTFFTASSVTSSAAISNLIFYLLQNPELKDKLFSEIDSKLMGIKDFIRDLTINQTEDMDWLKMCFYESLRIEPPLSISTPLCLN